MNYIGSKYRLLPFIQETIFQTIGNTHGMIYAELFAGTGIVSRAFKQHVKLIIINDLEFYSFVINRNYIGNHICFEYHDLIDNLNNLPGIEGKIYNDYCLGGGTGRQYFSDENGKRIDVIRQMIESWKSNQTINDDQYYFLLASLLESADKIANVASVYGAYLKHLKKSAQKPLVLRAAEFEPTVHMHHVYQQDANELVQNISGDILYLDPPYNARQYGANYHLLNTIAIYDDFIPKGKTGLRAYNRSEYCKRGKVETAFEDLIRHAKFSYIFLSYNNEGLMSVEQVKAIMSKYGQYSLKTKKYQRFKADKDSNRNYKADSTEEHLHVLLKG